MTARKKNFPDFTEPKNGSQMLAEEAENAKNADVFSKAIVKIRKLIKKLDDLQESGKSEEYNYENFKKKCEEIANSINFIGDNLLERFTNLKSIQDDIFVLSTALKDTLEKLQDRKKLIKHNLKSLDIVSNEQAKESFQNYYQNGNLKKLLKICGKFPVECKNSVKLNKKFYEKLKIIITQKLKDIKFSSLNDQEKMFFLEKYIGNEILNQLFKKQNKESDIKTFLTKFDELEDHDSLIDFIIDKFNEILSKLFSAERVMRNTSKDKFVSNLIESTKIAISSKNAVAFDKSNTQGKSI